ncbi:MAG: transposase [Gammaproteobacteria bacterium]|nr:transposase [Gammaproteobacteria bacterium]
MLTGVFVGRLWRSVKYEYVYLHEWERVMDARKGLKKYFNFYNNKRPHQSLEGQTPNSVHKMITKIGENWLLTFEKKWSGFFARFTSSNL